MAAAAEDDDATGLERSVDDEGYVNKENNDSAIGINASFASASTTPTVGRSPSASATSSSTSSPDSGASSSSPKSDKNDVDVIDALLQQTSIVSKSCPVEAEADKCYGTQKV